MKYSLYQIKLTEQTAPYAFTGRKELLKFGLSFPPPRELYTKVYEGECEKLDPNRLFEEHNRPDRPARMQIRSMSVSDVIEYDLDGEKLAVFVDSFYFPAIRFDDSGTSEIACSYFTKDGYTYVNLKDEGQEFVILSDHLLSGAKYFKDQNGQNTKLTSEQIYAALLTITQEQNKLKYNQKPKTYLEWSSTGAPLDRYADLGDEVDEAIVNNFLEMLPPACHTTRLVQMGEPNELLPNEKGDYCPTFMTFERVGSKWYFRGYCFHGDTQNQHRFPSFYETLAKLLK